jgi:predicted protein tyrosine phosphatase
MVKITSVLALAHAAKSGKLKNNVHSVISIRDSGKSARAYDLIDNAMRSENIHVVIMDDIQRDMPCVDGLVMPSRELIESVLKFAMGRDNIIVHCTAGVSRSSAIAFLVECQRIGDPIEAVKILNPLIHYPNMTIVDIGGEVLGMDVVKVIKEFNSSALEACFDKDNS